jgi:O-antigen/teichoic acid export membrane protein
MSVPAAMLGATPEPPPIVKVDAAHTMRRGGAFAIFGQGSKLCLQLLSTAILARILAPADFGLLALVTPIVAFFSVFRDVGLTSATIYNDDITAAESSSLFWVNVAAGLIVAAVLMLLAPIASNIYHDPRLIGILQALAITFVLNGIGAQYQALLQREFHFKLLTSIDVGANLLGTAIGILAATHGFGYWSLIVMPVATQLFILIATVSCSHWQPGRPRWESRTTSMTRFGSAITGFNLFNYFSRNLDNLLIGKVWGMEALGFYGRAYGLMTAPITQVIYPLSQVVVPVLSRLKNDREQYVSTYLNLMRVVMLACVPLVTCLLVSREWVVAILLGPRWHAVTDIFLALGFAALVQPINASAGWLMLSQGRSTEVFRWGVLSGFITVGGILIGLPWGSLAVASAYSLTNVLLITPLLWWFCCRSGYVRMSHLVEVSLPVWLCSAIAGVSFEVLSNLVAPQFFKQLQPWAGLVIACIWVIGWTGVLLLLHPRGRIFLTTALKLLKQRRKPEPEFQ